MCYRFAEIDKERFGSIEDVTDKGYYTNSYHVDVREKIDAFHKFEFESQFQTISSGGAISYVEIPNMQHNLPALEEIVKFIYDNIQYADLIQSRIIVIYAVLTARSRLIRILNGNVRIAEIKTIIR